MVGGGGNGDPNCCGGARFCNYCFLLLMILLVIVFLLITLSLLFLHKWNRVVYVRGCCYLFGIVFLLLCKVLVSLVEARFDCVCGFVFCLPTGVGWWLGGSRFCFQST